MADKKDKYCSKCNQKADDKDKYCVQCGSPLINGCSNKGDLFTKKCSKVNRDDAAYCASCGAPTIFYLQGLVKGTKMNNDREERR
ncbi:MAG: zinc ribbon domain-containing protein [Gorillibacterium sp.]|nr:zinc ribbon domain-containing protein [Gorillibacterium sp.]